MQRPDAPVKSEEERAAVLLEMVNALRAIWNKRIYQKLKLDLISMMLHNPEMQELTEREFVGNLVLLFVAGYDTTKNSMSGGILAESGNLDQRMKLEADPPLVPSLIGESVRYQSPIIHIWRTASRDVVFANRTIRADDRVVMWYISVNRDDAAIDAPESTGPSKTSTWPSARGFIAAWETGLPHCSCEFCGRRSSIRISSSLSMANL